jgi:hypothetical protein
MYTPIWNAVLNHLSAERMRAEIAEFFEFSRWSSYDKIVGLAKRIAGKMEAAGMEDVQLIEFPADGRTAYGGWFMPRAYDVHEARLTAHVAGEPALVLADYHQNPTSLMLYSLPTPPEGVTADLVVADALEDFTPERLSGRLVLTSGIGVEYGLAAMRAGARGLVSDCRNGPASTRIAPRWTERMNGITTPYHPGTIRTKGSASLSLRSKAGGCAANSPPGRASASTPS